MRYLIVAIVILFSPPVFAVEDLNHQFQETFDHSLIQEEIEYLRIHQEHRWREEDERREQEEEDLELEKTREQIEKEYRERIQEIQRRMNRGNN